MLNEKTLKEIETTFDHGVMIDVIRFEMIITTKKIKKRHVTGTSFSGEVQSQFSYLCQKTPEHSAFIQKVFEAAGTVETRESFQGLGGCVAITLVDAMKEIENNS